MATLGFYPDDGSLEVAEHNAECLRLKAWQEGIALPAMTVWDRRAEDRRERTYCAADPQRGDGPQTCRTDDA